MTNEKAEAKAERPAWDYGFSEGEIWYLASAERARETVTAGATLAEKAGE